MNGEYSSAELMAAILDLRDFTEAGLMSVRTELRAEIGELRTEFCSEIGKLRHDMNKRFDSVDLRFDAFEKRLHILESR